MMKVKPVPVFETNATVLQQAVRKSVIVSLSSSFYRFLPFEITKGTSLIVSKSKYNLELDN